MCTDDEDSAQKVSRGSLLFCQAIRLLLRLKLGGAMLELLVDKLRGMIKVLTFHLNRRHKANVLI